MKSLLWWIIPVYMFIGIILCALYMTFLNRDAKNWIMTALILLWPLFIGIGVILTPVFIPKYIKNKKI